MPQGQIRWNPLTGQGQEGSVTATLIANVNSDGSVHMETSGSQGGYSGDFKTTTEAAAQFRALLDQGSQEAQNTTR